MHNLLDKTAQYNPADIKPVAAHTFNRAALETIALAQDICQQRGSEYQDSWAEENLKTSFLDNLLRQYPSADACPPQLEKKWKRLIVMASLCDVKISRLTGPFKLDTTTDLLNYCAAFTSLRLEFDSEVDRLTARATKAELSEAGLKIGR